MQTRQRHPPTNVKLYDGGPHRPVPNSRGCWEALLAFRAYPPQPDRVEKPTPIGAKARVIYVDGVTA